MRISFSSLIITALLFCDSVAHPLSKRSSSLPRPHADPFYDAPDNLDSLKPGEIYNKRTVETKFNYPSAKSVVQIAYRTSDSLGDASYTVATVFTPQSPDEEPKLYSHQVWEDSDSIDCSPSYSLFEGFDAPDGYSTAINSAIFIDWALNKGYYVVSADHEGPHSTFLAGYNEGYAGIDGIRAALNDLNLAGDTPVAMYGYSGAAHVTVWMSELVGTYAPELKIVGAAHGGTPVDPKGTMQFLDGKEYSGLVIAAFAGWMEAYPSLKKELLPYLTDTLKNDLNAAWSNKTCFLNEIGNYSNIDFNNLTSLPDFYSFPPVVSVFNRESLLSDVSSHTVPTPKFPRYVFHAVNDEIIPYDLIEKYVSQQCSNGANIQFVPWSGGEHLTTAFFGIPNAMQFLQQAFEGKTPELKCGTSAQDILTLTTVGVGSYIGDDILDFIMSLNGAHTPMGTIDLDT